MYLRSLPRENAVMKCKQCGTEIHFAKGAKSLWQQYNRKEIAVYFCRSCRRFFCYRATYVFDGEDYIPKILALLAERSAM